MCIWSHWVWRNFGVRMIKCFCKSPFQSNIVDFGPDFSRNPHIPMVIPHCGTSPRTLGMYHITIRKSSFNKLSMIFRKETKANGALQRASKATVFMLRVFCTCEGDWKNAKVVEAHSSRALPGDDLCRTCCTLAGTL